MAVTTPTVWYANYGNGSSTGYFAIPVWHQPWTPTVGTITRQTAPTVANERCFICTTSGAVGVTEPTWTVATAGTKTTDSSATWYECTGQPGLNGDVTSTPLSSQNRSGAQSLGAIITNNTQDHYFLCTTAGTTGAGEPTYNTTAGVTTTDGTCVWTCLGAVSSFTAAWAAPYSRLLNASTQTFTKATVQTLYVSSAHAETTSSGATIFFGTTGDTSPPQQVICIKNASSQLPPAVSDITTGASFTGTSSGTLVLTGNVEYNGITFVITGSAGPNIGGFSTRSFVRLRNGSLSFSGNNSFALKFIFFSNVELINTTIAFGGVAAQGIAFGLSGSEGCSFIWRDTASALSASTWPTNLFLVASGGAASVLIEGVDLSGFNGTAYFDNAGQEPERIVLSHCKLASKPLQSSVQTAVGPTIDLINCDTGGNTYMTQRISYALNQSISTTVIASGGASDGTTAYSWSLTGGASTLAWTQPFESMPICIWNTKTAANVTVTIQAAYVGTALPYNDQLWVDVRYFGTASSTLSTFATSTMATVLSTHTQWSASAALWGTAAAARQNSHAYVAADVIGVSSGSSIVRAFVCTTAGTSSGSLPGAYASAVDGTQVTDGTAVFTAVVRFAMTLTLSTPQPQEAGYLLCYVKCGLSNSTSYPTFFVDPSVALT